MQRHSSNHGRLSRRTGALLFGVLYFLCAAATIRPLSARAQTRAEFVPTFSTNARVKQQMDRLAKLATAKQWDPWLAGYQQLVDDPRDLVVERDQEFLVGVRWTLHQQLAGLPPQVRQRYRQLYDNEARKVFDRATAERDGDGMRDVYSRYRFSSFGSKALLWLANDAQDRGRHEMARVAFSRLAKEPGVTVQVLLRYALAASGANRSAEARGVLDRVKREFGGHPLQLAGENTTGAAAADRVGASLAKEKPADATSWRAFAGTGDRRIAAPLAGKVKKLWEFSHPTVTDRQGYSSGQQVMVGGYSSNRSRFSFLTFPVIENDRIWVQGPRNLTAVKLADGKAAWDQQDFVLAPNEVTAQQQQQPQGRFSSSNYRTSRPLQAAPSLDDHLLITRVGMGATGPSSGSRWPVDYAIGAFDSRTGRPVWRKVAGGDPAGTYFNIPTVQSKIILSGVATNKGGITEYNAVALDAGTGETLWSRYLGAGSDPLGVMDGSPPAVRDGTVWIESSLYTLNGLDLITGDLRLVYHYDPGQRTAYGGFNSSPNLNNEAISAIGLAPRTTVDKREVSPVVFAPRWGVYVIALDADTGRLLWSTPKAPGRSTTGSLFAVDAKRAYVCGDHVQAIKLADGAPDWTWETQKLSSGEVGFAALGGDRIYIPVEGKIYVLSAEDGREIEVMNGIYQQGNSPGFSAVLPLGNHLIMTTRDGLVAFGPE
jgi:outer membrane protein assembly factor BamB